MDGAFTLMRPMRDMPEKSALWAKLEALGKEEGVGFAPNVELQNMRAVEHLVRALELAGPDLTREGLIEALEDGFDGSWQCSACVAPTIYGPQDHWMGEVMQFTMWNNATKHYDVVIETMDYETSKGLGLRGNYPGLECQPPSAEFPEGTCPWKEAS